MVGNASVGLNKIRINIHQLSPVMKKIVTVNTCLSTRVVKNPEFLKPDPTRIFNFFRVF